MNPIRWFSSTFSKTSWTEKRILIPIILTAVILRVMVAIYLGDSLTTSQQVRAYDQITYNLLAQSLLAGRGYSFTMDYYPGFTPANTPTAHWSFLYPIFLSGVYSMTGFHPLVARLVQAVLVGILEPWLVFRLGKALFSSKVGLIAAGLSAVYAYFIFFDATLMTEPFFIITILASTLLALNLSGMAKDAIDRQNKSPFWVLNGIVFGLGALLRQTILLWLPFQLGWITWALYRDRVRNKGTWKMVLKGVGIAVGMVLLIVLPWTVRNYRVYQSILPLNSNAGYAIYSANHPDHGIHFDQDYAAPLPDDLLARGLNEADWNQALTSMGIGFILQDPIRYLLLTASKFAVHFNFWFSPESSLFSNLLRVFSFGLYLPLFITGLVLSWKEKQRCSLVYMFLIVFNLIHILTWSGTRYRLPSDAVLMPFAGLAVYTMVSKVMERRKTGDGKPGENLVSKSEEGRPGVDQA